MKRVKLQVHSTASNTPAFLFDCLEDCVLEDTHRTG